MNVSEDLLLIDEVRILHTADVHIGARFEFLRLRGDDQRDTVRETFTTVVQKAREGRYHLLIIAGDLFDSAYSVAERDLSFVLKCLGETGCHVVILPGSHDYWSAGSVFEMELRRFESCGNVNVFNPQERVITFPELSLAVHGKALISPHTTEGAISELQPLEGFKWNIAVAHGSVVGISGVPKDIENPIYLDELQEGFDYIALGHWHSYLVVKQEEPPVIYSGAPELIARDQRGAGSVASVTITDASVSASRVDVGRRHVVSAVIDCSGVETTEELVRKVVGNVPEDKDCVLELSLTGVIATDAVIDPFHALEMLQDHYFSVRLTGERPAREMSRDDLLATPETTVAGKFIRLLLEQIEKSTGTEKDLLEEALQMGYQLFRGRNPLV